LDGARRGADVLGIGNSCVDLLMRVQHYPQAGDTAPLLRADMQPGGQVASAMIGCARLGLRAKFALRTGKDAAGDRQHSALEREGVDLSLARQIDGVPSAKAYIVIDEQTGERGVIWNTDTRLRVLPADLDEMTVTSSRALYFDGQDEEACLVAARWARAAGIPVISDIDMVRPGTASLVPCITDFISNAEFTIAYGAEPDLKAAMVRIASQGPRIVCATLGPDGAVAFDGREFIHSPAFAVHAVDTTGAGDAFHAGYVHALLAGLPLPERLRFANATAGLACTVVGAQAGLPRLSAVEALLQSNTELRPPSRVIA
jgi:sugar/nucleoside kinase (ribokinase family)